MIIILATIVIRGTGDSAEEARFARFAQEFSDFQDAIDQQFLFAYKRYALKAQSVSKAQIYYGLATGQTVTSSTTPVAAGTVASLSIQPSALLGTNYYEIANDTNIPNWSEDKGYTTARSAEHHYITDEGELFTLPGYTYRENGTTSYYVNASKYYTGSMIDVEDLASGGTDLEKLQALLLGDQYYPGYSLSLSDGTSAMWLDYNTTTGDFIVGYNDVAYRVVYGEDTNGDWVITSVTSAGSVNLSSLGMHSGSLVTYRGTFTSSQYSQNRSIYWVNNIDSTGYDFGYDASGALVSYRITG